ncbi:MAG: TIGR01906 family membrane protein [Erysipelotrichaceae bacterium]|nr:TIGR01906 family membrane protein [Erysipelotrichaceae bacterium]
MKTKLSFVFGLSFTLMCLLGSVRIWALNENFYIQKYQQMDLAGSLRVESKDLERCITVLMDYLNDSRDDIHVEITQNGSKREAFDQRETIHMVDVKALYQNAMKVLAASIVLTIASGIYLFRQPGGTLDLARGILLAGVCFLFFITWIGIWIATDFTDFWTRFHLLFFDNDYWLLTPGVDFMIDMLPEQVFEALVIRIVVTLTALLGTANILALFTLKRRKALL